MLLKLSAIVSQGKESGEAFSQADVSNMTKDLLDGFVAEEAAKRKPGVWENIKLKYRFNSERIAKREDENEIVANSISKDIRGFIEAISSQPEMIDVLNFVCSKEDYPKWLRSTYTKPENWDDDKPKQNPIELSKKSRKVLNSFIEGHPIKIKDGADKSEESKCNDSKVKKKAERTLSDFIDGRPVNMKKDVHTNSESKGFDVDKNKEPKLEDNKPSKKSQMVMDNFVNDRPLYTRDEVKEFGRLKLGKESLKIYHSLIQAYAQLLGAAGVEKATKVLRGHLRNLTAEWKVQQVADITPDHLQKSSSFYQSELTTALKNTLTNSDDELKKPKTPTLLLDKFQEKLEAEIKKGLGSIGIPERTEAKTKISSS